MRRRHQHDAARRTRKQKIRLHIVEYDCKALLQQVIPAACAPGPYANSGQRCSEVRSRLRVWRFHPTIVLCHIAERSQSCKIEIRRSDKQISRVVDNVNGVSCVARSHMHIGSSCQRETALSAHSLSTTYPLAHSSRTPKRCTSDQSGRQLLQIERARCACVPFARSRAN